MDPLLENDDKMDVPLVKILKWYLTFYRRGVQFDGETEKGLKTFI